MIHVFHVFKKHARIPKAYYNNEMRKVFSEWSSTLPSPNGYLKENQLVLPKGCTDQREVQRLGAVLIQDIIGYSSEQEKRRLVQHSQERGSPGWVCRIRIERQNRNSAKDSRVWENSRSSQNSLLNRKLTYNKKATQLSGFLIWSSWS